MSESQEGRLSKPPTVPWIGNEILPPAVIDNGLADEKSKTNYRSTPSRPPEPAPASTTPSLPSNSTATSSPSPSVVTALSTPANGRPASSAPTFFRLPSSRGSLSSDGSSRTVSWHTTPIALPAILYVPGVRHREDPNDLKYRAPAVAAALARVKQAGSKPSIEPDASNSAASSQTRRRLLASSRHRRWRTTRLACRLMRKVCRGEALMQYRTVTKPVPGTTQLIADSRPKVWSVPSWGLGFGGPAGSGGASGTAPGAGGTGTGLGAGGAKTRGGLDGASPTYNAIDVYSYYTDAANPNDGEADDFFDDDHDFSDDGESDEPIAEQLKYFASLGGPGATQLLGMAERFEKVQSEMDGVKHEEQRQLALERLKRAGLLQPIFQSGQAGEGQTPGIEACDAGIPQPASDDEEEPELRTPANSPPQPVPES